MQVVRTAVLHLIFFSRLSLKLLKEFYYTLPKVLFLSNYQAAILVMLRLRKLEKELKEKNYETEYERVQGLKSVEPMM